MHFIKNYGLLIVFIGFAIFYFLRYKRTPNIQTEEINLINQKGENVLLSEQLDGNTVVHFYASWCGPCRAEMADIKNHFDALKKKGLNFIFITDDSQDKIAAFQNNMPQEIQFFQIASLKDIDIYTIPATYFYNAKKEMVKKHLGPISWSNEKEVNELILPLNQ